MLFPSWIYFFKRGNKPIYLKEYIFYLSIYFVCHIYMYMYMTTFAFTLYLLPTLL